MLYQFADLSLDLDRHRLDRNGEPIELSKLTFDVLRVLVEAAPNLVTDDELIEKAWGADRVISPENLNQRIKMLRQGLGEDAHNPIYMERVRGLGFRLIPAVRAAVESDDVEAQSGSRFWQGGLVAGVLIVAALAWFLSDQEADFELPRIDLARGISIAVLPFVNMSGDPANDFLGDGIAEETINTLVRQTNLPVASRTSSFQFKNQQVDDQEIGERLNVTHLLEGSVRKSGNRVRITAQLIDSPTGYHLWSEQYDRPIDDLFEVQSEIASHIVDEIKRQLEAQGEGRLQAAIGFNRTMDRGSADPAAYEAYLKGLQHLNRLMPDDIELALEYFEEAYRIEPTFYGARRRLLEILLLASHRAFLLLTPADAYARIERILETALKDSPNDPFLIQMHGQTLAYNQYRWEEGIAEMGRALPLIQNDPVALHFASIFYMGIGLQAFGMELSEKAHKLDPHSPQIRAWLGMIYAINDRQDEAIEIMDIAGWGYYMSASKGTANFMMSRANELDQNIREAKKHVRADHPAILTLEGLLLLTLGDTEAAQAIGDSLADRMDDQPLALGFVRISKERRDEVQTRGEQQRMPVLVYWMANWKSSDPFGKFLHEKMKIDDIPISWDERGPTVSLSESERQDVLKREVPVPVAELQQYVGTFRTGVNQIRITLVDDRLYYERPWEAGALVRVGEGEFVSMKEYDSDIKFLANHHGEMDLCIWQDGQLNYIGYRDDALSEAL